MYAIYKKEVSIEQINTNDVDPIAVCDTYDVAEVTVEEGQVIYEIDDNGDAIKLY